LLIIKAGANTILASGTAIAFEKAPLEFKLKGSSEEISVIFDFVDTGASGSNPEKLGAESLGPGTLKLVLTDFNNVLGSGTTKPIKLGSLDGKDLFVHFRVYDLKGSDKMMHYAFYLGP